jgi:phosphohistidine phosphatase
MSTQKTLYILRHAKAEAGASYQDDHQRPLNERGHEAAGVMGKYLLKSGIRPELVMCSTAERAMQTFAHVQEAYNKHPLAVEYTEQLYLASANEMLKLIAETAEKVTHLMLVGHNPGLHQLALKLAKSGDETVMDSLTLKYPTCTFAAFDLGEINWREAGRCDSRMTAFVTPHTLTGVTSD